MKKSYFAILTMLRNIMCDRYGDNDDDDEGDGDGDGDGFCGHVKNFYRVEGVGNPPHYETLGGGNSLPGGWNPPPLRSTEVGGKSHPGGDFPTPWKDVHEKGVDFLCIW